MKCDKCGMPMVIDEWNGWIWTCCHCANIGRTATDEEIEEQEESWKKIASRSRAGED